MRTELFNSADDNSDAAKANALLPLGSLIGAVMPANMVILYIALAIAAAAAVGYIVYLLLRNRKHKTLSDKNGESEEVSEDGISEGFIKLQPELVSAEQDRAVRASEVNKTVGTDETVISEIGVYNVIKYDKSFTAKLKQSEADVKECYNSLKREIMSYKGVKSRMSWKGETFKIGREHLMRIGIRGRTLSAYFALNPSDYTESKYKVEDVSDIAKNAEVPCLYRIKSALRLRYAKELIAELCIKHSLSPLKTRDTTDYALQFPYDTTENLLKAGLIKLLNDDGGKSSEISAGGENAAVGRQEMTIIDEAADKTALEKV